MGLFMLVIILYFAKDEKKRTEANENLNETSAIGSMAPVGKESLYNDIQAIN